MLRDVATAALVAFGSLWGLLARLGLTGLNTYDGKSIAPLVWAQAVGCVVMGYISHDESKAVLQRWYAPLHAMIGTGFAASCTTFSTWMLDVFQAYSNFPSYDRHGLHNVMDALTQTGATVGMSIVAFWAGHALVGVVSLKELGRHVRLSGTGPVVDLAAMVLGLAFWIGAALFCGLYAPFRNVTFALSLAPFGALIRWQLSRLNPKLSADTPMRIWDVHRWPLGTMTANLLATAAIASSVTAMYVGRVQGHASRSAYTKVSCEVLQGLQDGFCGSLSTVSTLIAEIVTMQPRRVAAAYLIACYALSMLLCVLLLGAPWWALGMQGGCRVW